MRVGKEIILVTGSALLTLSGISLFCCPTARAGSPAAAQSHAQPAASPAPSSSESDLDDDRAEHWAVPGIAREERVQCEALAGILVCAGAFSARRRGQLKGQKRRG